MYRYNAVIDSVYDGNTCTATVDLGFNIKQAKVKLRLNGLDAPELRGETKEKARVSRDYLRSLVLGKEVEIETTKDKKGEYGRYLVDIWVTKDEARQLVNDLLVIYGHAIKRYY